MHDHDTRHHEGRLDADEIRTFADADRWLEENGLGNYDEGGARLELDALAGLVADALRARGEIDPQTYAAVYGNPDYIDDAALFGGLKLTGVERDVIQRAAR